MMQQPFIQQFIQRRQSIHMAVIQDDIGLGFVAANILLFTAPQPWDGTERLWFLRKHQCFSSQRARFVADGDSENWGSAFSNFIPDTARGSQGKLSLPCGNCR